MGEIAKGWDGIVPLRIAPSIVPPTRLENTENKFRVILGILLLIRLDFLAHGHITTTDGIEDTKPGAEMHEIENRIDTTANLENDIFRALVIYDEIPALRVMTEETDEFVENLNVRIFELELVGERTDLVNVDHGFFADTVSEEKVVSGKDLRPFLF